ncbi:probable WRKY transcription factor 12 isoform X2 [Gastrolobium bilobum]|uniref:probable WRKY transcription factor 12 isoform X2 n=1 Tax=Gastrolobium bilobum TaxID=150636 RepID=UPI002AB0F1AC|nr:probable WRKY transcription factor 12 isoform X2 [Gastrolobium bilobum]
MSTTSQTIVNHSLFEDQDQIPTQMGFIPFSANLTFPSLGCHPSLKSISVIAPSLSSEAANSTANFAETLLATSVQKPQDLTSIFGGGSRVNSGAWGEVTDYLIGKRSGGDDQYLGVSAMKMKKIKARRKVREPRFCFKTMSDVDVLDDGYKWRKYGQKVVKNTQHPSYYRCTQDNCRVKKRVERLAEDPRMVITTYEGRHVHSPSNELEDSQTSSELSNFLW